MSKKLNVIEKERAKKIGETIYIHLKIKNISQLGLSNKTNIPPTTISSYVRGISIPSFENLEKICNALDISMDVFNFSKRSNRNDRNSAIEFLNKLSCEHFIGHLNISAKAVSPSYRTEEDYDNDTPSNLVITFNDTCYNLDMKSLDYEKIRLLLEEIDNFIEKKSISLFKELKVPSAPVKEEEDI